jgi:alpha-beta hydrolase superfamily lysophospholipase
MTMRSTSRAARRATRAGTALLAVTLLAAACAGGSARRGPAATTAAPAVTLPLEQPASRCGPPGDRATLLRFPSSDGVQLSAAMVGAGSAGVVLVHQYPADLCGFWPYAVYLAHKGLRVLDLDVRCYGRSSCPEGDAKGHVADDVAAAAAELRRQGATRVALVGASMGGTAVLVAGASIRPAVAAVVSLSGERDLSALIGLPLNAGPAVPHLTSPTLYLVATGDSTVSVQETRALYRATRAADKRLVVLSGANDGRHGWDLLTDYPGHWTPVAAEVAAFLRAHTGT